MLDANGFQVKLNVVMIKGFNENEIIDFIELTKDRNLQIRFIEFMPFDGNQWNKEKLVSYAEIMAQVENYYAEAKCKTHARQTQRYRQKPQNRIL